MPAEAVRALCQKECGCPHRLGDPGTPGMGLVACRHLDGALVLRLWRAGDDGVVVWRKPRNGKWEDSGARLDAFARTEAEFYEREAELLRLEEPARA